MSMLMPFSASTIRVRWLHGSLGAEKSVMMDRLLDKFPLPPVTTRRWDLPAPRGPSMDVFPVFLLQKHREPRERDQEQHHEHAVVAALDLRRLTRVVEEVHGITNEPVVVALGEPSRHDELEFLEFTLGAGLAILAGLRDLAIDGLLDTLDFRQHVRHGRAIERQVVAARGLRAVVVE